MEVAMQPSSTCPGGSSWCPYHTSCRATAVLQGVCSLQARCTMIMWEAQRQDEQISFFEERTFIAMDSHEDVQWFWQGVHCKWLVLLVHRFES